MNKNKYALIIAFFIKFNAISQTVEPSSLIPKNNLQIELESLYTIQKENSEKRISISIPSALFRFGLTSAIELQLNTPIIKEKLWKNDHLVHSLNKFDDIQLGFSVNLWEEKNVLPEASLMVRTILPTDTEFKIQNFGKICSLNLSNQLSDKLTINYNIGYAVETDATKSGFYIANLSYEVSPKVHFFAENFGDFNDEKLISHNLNFGGGYNFSDKFMIDVSIANGLNHNMFYIGGILTWVINTQNN